MTGRLGYGSVIVDDKFSVTTNIYALIPKLVQKVASALEDVDSKIRPIEVELKSHCDISGTVHALARIIGIEKHCDSTRFRTYISIVGDHSEANADATVITTSQLTDIENVASPCSDTWMRAMHSRLSDDQKFLNLIHAYDGTIGLEVDGATAHLRCYRGKIIEVSKRSISGADFTLEIPGNAYLDLMDHTSNDFMKMAMMRKFNSSGSGYEYLRMTSALIRIFDIARALHIEELHG